MSSFMCTVTHFMQFGYPIAATGVFAPIIQSLLQAGYTAGIDLRGAPVCHMLECNGCNHFL